MRQISKPQPGEYASFAARYIEPQPDDGAVLDRMLASVAEVTALVSPLGTAYLTTPHAPGEWTIQDVVQHVLDVERVMAYRALRIARGDDTPLAGFDENAYARGAAANQRAIADILAEYTAVRQATLALLQSLPSDALTAQGVANGNMVTVRALVYLMAGHERHHIESIHQNYLR